MVYLLETSTSNPQVYLTISYCILADVVICFSYDISLLGCNYRIQPYVTNASISPIEGLSGITDLFHTEYLLI
jgi:hypothetical protein